MQKERIRSELSEDAVIVCTGLMFVYNNRSYFCQCQKKVRALQFDFMVRSGLPNLPADRSCGTLHIAAESLNRVVESESVPLPDDYKRFCGAS